MSSASSSASTMRCDSRSSPCCAAVTFDRGRAGHRQDRPGQGHRPQPRLHVPAHTVHTGSAVRRDRPVDLQPEDAGIRIGPTMSQVVLADEINRATPKTQSSLLECMEERQATTDGVTHPMPDPFLVIATQNPIEYEGTFALPEAQLDRFMPASAWAIRSRSRRSSSSTSRSGPTRSRSSSRSSAWRNCAGSRTRCGRSTSIRPSRTTSSA